MQLPQQLQAAKQALQTVGAQTLQELRETPPSWRRRIWSFVVSLALVVGMLLIWNLAQNFENRRARLWGEFLFVVIVVWFALVVLSGMTAWAIRQSRRLRRFRIYPIGRLEALVWAGITVATVPLAVLYRWESVIVLAASLGFAALVRVVLRFRYSWARHFLPYYSVVLFASLTLGAAAWWWTAPELEAATPARATDAVAEGDDLAAHFRPLLFFDSSETFEPVDIDESVRHGESVMHGCTQGIGAEQCDNPVEPSGPLDEFDYVTVEGSELRPGEQPGGPDSAYYHHVVDIGVKVYIDYWWYFARNPAPVARGILCGQALRWLNVACHEHPADWEGITLVLEDCEPGSEDCETDAGNVRVVEARYAQHEKVVRYPWQILQRRWEADYRKWFKDAGQRPLVFVALHSHASYAGPCEKCDQIVHPAWEERRDGDVRWQNNDDGEDGCPDDCLKPVPVGASGEPVGWNAFPGRWGTRLCILFGSYCDIQEAPRAPAFQKRYEQLSCPPTLCIRSSEL